MIAHEDGMAAVGQPSQMFAGSDISEINLDRSAAQGVRLHVVICRPQSGTDHGCKSILVEDGKWILARNPIVAGVDDRLCTGVIAKEEIGSQQKVGNGLALECFELVVQRVGKT